MTNRQHMSHDEYIARQRDRARVLAQQVLSADMSPILGARLIVSLSDLGRPDIDEDLQTLRVIDSETDHLPVGDGRQDWAPEALARKADEVAKAENWAREVGRSAFERLARYTEAV